MLDLDDVMSSLELSDGLDIYEVLESVLRIVIEADDLDDNWLITFTDYDDEVRMATVTQDYEVIDIKRWFITQGIEREVIKVKG